MYESSAVRHYLEKSDMGLSRLIFEQLHNVVDLVNEFKKIEDLSVLAHAIGYSATEESVSLEFSILSTVTSMLRHLFLHLRNSRVSIADVHEPGNILNDAANLVSTFAGTEH